MTRLTLFLAAAALAAAPSPARAQPGAAAGARPSRPVDECGKPAQPRPRRSAASAPGASATQGPRVLGTPAGGAAASPEGAHPGAAASATPVAAGSTTAGAQSATPAAGSGTPQAAPSASTPTTSGTPAAAGTTAGAGTAPGSSATVSGAPGSSSTASGAPGSSATAAGAASSPAGQQGAYSATAATVPQASSTSVETAQSSTSAGSQFLTAGADAPNRPIDPRAARRNRDALRLGLGELGDRKRLGPAASVSVPTAFGVDAGELFFGVAYQGRTRYTQEDDAAAVIGIGVGTRRIVAVEAALTTFSTIRSYPLETGGVSLKVHSALPRQTSVAVGWENAIRWGGSDDDGSLYGVVTRLVNVRGNPDAPFSTAVFTVGLGNGRFRFEDDDADGNQTVNLFAAAGARVTPYVSLVADWTGQDLNAAASLTPLRHIPVVVTVGLADLTGTAGDGARFILSLGYGLAFRQPF
ncbi:MAG TPA: hypothetical protein VF006_14450 [Longimicrobium sp.]